MNTLAFVTLAVVAWLFFLSGSSFLFLFSLAILLLYSIVDVGGPSRHHHHEQTGRSGDPGGNGAAMEKTAGAFGDVINVVGTLFGKLFIWAFKGEKK
ncbi:MAG: hypothetical protein WC408_06955 [Candidatus Micrarchaeia archaeon]